MISVSLSEARVYFIVKAHGPIGPSNIGFHLDKSYTTAAASVNRQLKKLVALGLVEKEAKNKRVVSFRVKGPTPIFHVRGDETDPVYLRFRNYENC